MWRHRKVHPFPGKPVGGRRSFWDRLHWAAAPILLFGCGRTKTAISPSKTRNMDPTASCKQPHADEETLRTVIMVSQDKDTLYGTWNGPSGSTNGPSGSTNEWVPPEDVDPTASCKQPHADEETLRTVIMVSQDKDTLYLGPSGSTNGPSGSTNEWVPPEDVGKILGSVQAATGALDPCPSWRVKSARERTGRWLEPIINERARCH
ncbi:uncharacterized protein LOC128325762 isoform X10 [Hemicordylus capensis]|uniref:uncharacterized protein LOC128325762 isoform X9 n=1 Tax=Hemicordylus capensis TaxID=884348 RepID=UPI0023047D40|nr:uncharacterized protein LOC128325762 isoform X9 [Hemicordylus capensis]XP_053107541.1 uncharacterized protein LOC128325762 isoform X10 [Hemicordylus capensis]